MRGGKDNYRYGKIEEIRLPSGQSILRMRSLKCRSIRVPRSWGEVGFYVQRREEVESHRSREGRRERKAGSTAKASCSA